MLLEQLLEAIGLEKLRPHRELMKRGIDKNHHEHIFRNKNRIYKTFEPLRTQDFKLKKGTKDMYTIGGISWFFNSILDGEGWEVPEKYQVFKSTHEMVMKNKVFDTNKDKEVKLTKILNKIKNDKEATVALRKSAAKHLTRYYDSFLINKDKVDTNNMMMVLTRHPYDTLGKSTGRKWVSCKTMKPSGKISGSLAGEICEGALQIYLTHEGDKNLQNPVARVTAYPFKNDNKVVLRVTGDVYGLPVPTFKKQAENWIKKLFAIKKDIEYTIPKTIRDDADQRMHQKVAKKQFLKGQKRKESFLT